MTLAHRSQHLDRAGFLSATGVLLVLRDPPPAPPPSPGQPAAVPANPAEGPEILLALWEDGSATGLHGHVDLGTGLRTALSQLVAEELDLPMPQVTMVMGHTCSVPNQGATIASASIQVHGLPLRQAAAQARAWLQQQGATAADLQGRQVRLQLDTAAVLKPHEQHRVIGQPMPRVDIPAKATGELVFVHDMRVPGMLHGRVVRPPYAGVDAGDFVGRTLQSVDRASIVHVPGIVDLVVIGDFIGIVAEREDQAEAAMQALQVQWKPWPGLHGLGDVENAVRSNPATRRLLLEKGDVQAAIAGAAQPMPRSYLWPYQLHASIGPSCAVADWQADRLTVWAGTQNPHVLRADIAKLTGLADVQVDVVRMEAAGCYGRNGADDVAADAALLSRAVGRPVRVQLTREQEHAWEPKGAAQLMQIDGGLQADGSPAAYDFQTSYPSNGAPTLALLLTGTVPATATAYEMGDRTAVPPYDYPNLRVAANDMAPILRASWLRGVSALPNSFAHESYIDELAAAAGVDPVDYRLRWLKDERAAELVRATADKAGWRPHTTPQGQGAVDEAGDVLKGQGFAYARYVHSKFPGFGAAWAAWVADVEVNRVTGEVHVSRVVVGHDAGLMVNPAGVQHQVHGNVLQTTSRALKEQVRTEPSGPNIGAVATREWGSYPILSFREVPVVEVMLMPRPGEAPLGSGESASVPGTAAIANAIFDATGVRLRNPPFTPEVVRAALNPLPGPQEDAGAAAALPPAAEAPALPRPRLPPDAPLPRRRRGLWATGGALLAGLVGLGAAAFGWRPAIAPVAAGSSALVYTSQTIERGRLLAAAGDCVVCHTAPGGTPNAGGRAMHTPFGTVYSTNLTPYAATGIGQWSFSAFQRAMREGISRDGRHLYPAFPYTSFTKMTDDDLTALYAYLMAQPAVAHQPPATKLAFPFNLRPLMAMWNALYLVPGPVQPEPARSAEWNRGAYLVNGPGHCGACHTPRNAFGAERIGSATLSGAMVDGWEAPALTALSTAPLAWTADDFYSYLRHGFSPRHGVAGGPMAPVVHELQALPDGDIRAMATYLASFNAPADVHADADADVHADAQAARPAATPSIPLPDARARLFEGACGACHHDTPVPGQFGLDLPLGMNSNLHSARPDNLLRTILDGLQHPPTRDVGYMPAFRHALDDRQIADIAAYLRQRHAPDKPAWQDLASDVARLRQQPAH